ncbi:MAG: dihydrodipicolinate synthase family protein [Planctomycetota bacterium]
MTTGIETLKQNLKGVVVIFMTPFHDDLRLHEKAAARNLRFLISKGIRTGQGAIVVAGSIGECYALTNDERKRLAETVVAEARGEVPVLIGCNHSATAAAVDLAKHAEKIGADGLMLLPPSYATPPERKVYEWYRAVAAETSLGIMVYNNPLMVPVDISVDLLQKMADTIPNIIAVKECSENICRLDEGYGRLRPRLVMINGNCEEDEPCATLRGAAGYTTCIANFAPTLCLDLYFACRDRQWDRAWELHWKLMPAIKFMGRMFGDFRCFIKIAQELLGLQGGPVRPPALSPTPEDRQTVERLVKELGLTS